MEHPSEMRNQVREMMEAATERRTAALGTGVESCLRRMLLARLARAMNHLACKRELMNQFRIRWTMDDELGPAVMSALNHQNDADERRRRTSISVLVMEAALRRRGFAPVKPQITTSFKAMIADGFIHSPFPSSTMGMIPIVQQLPPAVVNDAKAAPGTEVAIPEYPGATLTYYAPGTLHDPCPDDL